MAKRHRDILFLCGLRNIRDAYHQYNNANDDDTDDNASTSNSDYDSFDTHNDVMVMEQQQQQQPSSLKHNKKMMKKDPFNLPNIRPILLDVTKEEDVSGIMDWISSRTSSSSIGGDGTYDDYDYDDDVGYPLTLMGIFNNAGVSELDTVEFQDLEMVRWQYDVNILGSVD